MSLHATQSRLVPDADCPMDSVDSETGLSHFHSTKFLFLAPLEGPMKNLVKLLLLVACAACLLSAHAQTAGAPDLTKQPTLYVVPYAHLDTQWRWEFPQTISENLLKTLKVNFYYFEKYPHYVFNWTGSNRYRLMKEYYPADYERMRSYVARGNWFPAGSSVEEGDVNLPSAESIIRQVLFGNTYYRKEFGKASAEYMLPDCFGFPASLPTILAHAGIKGFSTQKLSSGWQPAPLVGGPDSPEKTPVGIPFNVGVWEGPDGEKILAALNPLGYGSHIRYDLSKEPVPPAGLPADQLPRWKNSNPDWVSRIDLDGKVTGVYADYHYVGTGDIGGATDEETVKMLEALVTKGTIELPAPEGLSANFTPQLSAQPVRIGDGPVRVVSAAADQMFLDIKPEDTARMPHYKGDLELINHSAGSLTSQAYHKRWNRKNELLADSAEKASVAAAWMGGQPYPQQRLNDAWTLVMGGQFHDTGAGTATPRAYEFAQNDDVIAMNQFADVLTSATRTVAAALNTHTEGTPVVVFNSLNIAREDVVEAASQFPGEIPGGVRVIGPDGKEVLSQVEDDKVLFLAKAPSVGYTVYEIRRGEARPKPSQLKATESSIENTRYRVTLNSDGDVASIFDKSLNKELLSAPIRLAISGDNPRIYPAWNMEYEQEQAAPRAYVSGPAKIRIVENGPVRVGIEVTRQTEGSTFAQTVRLSAGAAGDHVEFSNVIDWRTLEANLKVVFPLSSSNPMATYNWEIGTIQRPNAYDRQFEVASHHWIDLTDKSDSYGATILTDVKNGSDKRDDRTIRLTLLRSPGPPLPAKPGAPVRRSYSDQYNQDWGRHEILFGLAGHAGDWRKGQTDWIAYRLSTPLAAFTTEKHTGTLGRTFSLVTVDNPRIRILALKKAEMTDETILRLVELDGDPARDVKIKFAGPIAEAREVNGQELPVGPASLTSGALQTSFGGYQPRTFALKLGAPPVHVEAAHSQPVKLNYDLSVASSDDTQSVGGFDKQGNALPAEMLPEKISFNGVDFDLAKAETGKPDALVARGQTISLPGGNFNRVYVLAASADGDQKAVFKTGSRSTELTIQNWGGFIGQWDTRLWKPAPDAVGNDPAHMTPLRKDWAVSANHSTWNDVTYRGSPSWSPRYPEDYIGLTHGYIKKAALAWYASHHHTPAGLNQPYAYSYLFAYPIDLVPGTASLTLPNNENIRILAISVAHEEPAVDPAHPLYDTLDWKGAERTDYTTAAQ
jgi:alpha-mannosidase